MTSHRNIRIRIVLPNRREMTISGLKRCKDGGIGGLSAEVFIAAPTVFADL